MLDQRQYNARHGISAAVIKSREEVSTEAIKGLTYVNCLLIIHVDCQFITENVHCAI